MRKAILSLFLIVICLIGILLISTRSVYAFPDTERIGVSGANPPFDFGFSGSVISALLKDDGIMIVAYGETLNIIDLGDYALDPNQPPALDEDEGTDGNLMAIAYSSGQNNVYAPQEDGDCLIYDLDDITVQPNSVEIVADNELGPIALDNNSQRAYIADNTDVAIHVLNLSSLSLESTITLNIPSVTSFSMTDAVHVKLTDEIYFSTDVGAVFYMSAGSGSVSEITIDSTYTDELSSLMVTPTGDHVYVTNKSHGSLTKISTSSHAIVDEIDISPNQSPTDIGITEVSNPQGGTGNAYYAYIAGSKGMTVMNTAGDLILDMGTDPDTDYEPLPMTRTPQHVLTSSVDDGYVYSINTSQYVDIITANPWVTISSVTYSGGGSQMGLGESVTITFQADETGTAAISSGGTVTGGGTALVDDTGASSWDVAVENTDIAVTINYDDNTSAFGEGDNDVFVFVTDADGNTGRIAITVSVDTPPNNVVMQSTGFGNESVYVIFERLTANDINHYNIYVDTSDTAVLTKTEVAAEIAQRTSGNTITGKVSGLTNTFVYYIAMEAVDQGGNVSLARTNTLSDGTLAYAIPQPTGGPVGFSGETGGCAIFQKSENRSQESGYFIIVSIFLLSIGLLVTFRKKKAAVVVLFFLFLFIVPLNSKASESYKPSPQWGCLEVKTGFWMPQSDAVNHFFTNCCNLITRIQGGLLIKGRYGVEAGVGILVKGGTAVGTISGEKSMDKFNFIMVPMETNFAWRMNYWSWDYLIPYVKVGVDYVYYRESLSGSATQGLKLGMHGGGGIQINTKVFGEHVLEEMDEDFGLNSMFFTLEAMYHWIDNFGGEGLDLSGPVYSIGLLFEF